jgi:hypothetical protein
MTLRVMNGAPGFGGNLRGGTFREGGRERLIAAIRLG